MKVIAAEHAGFCFGVSRAVALAHEAAARGPACTLGQLIHNTHVVEDLARQGVDCAKDIAEISQKTVIIRAHGETPQVLSSLEEKGYNLVDATCPFVQRIHLRARKAREEGVPIVIIGEPTHPEIVATRGWAGEEAHIVDSLEDVAALAPLERACVIGQTTYSVQKRDLLLAALAQKIAQMEVFDFICATTGRRQSEVERLAPRCDAFFVIGDTMSANTRKLFDCAKKYCEKTYLIASWQEIDPACLAPDMTVGVTAGASAPYEYVARTVRRLETLFPCEHCDIQMPRGESAGTIKEEERNMSEQDIITTAQEPEIAQDDFQAAFEKTLVSIRPGQLVTGTVVQLTDDEVCLNIGYKSDGIVPKAELMNQGDIKEMFKIGDELEVEVVKVNDGEGNVLLSQRSLLVKKNWDKLVAASEAGEAVTGIGKEVVKGGLIVNVEGIRTFVPASQLSERYVEKIDQFVGKELKLKIIEVDRSKTRLVASRKAVIAEESAARKAAAWEKIEKGATVKGVVRRLTDFGAFVDLGGVDGLIHVTDLSWSRVRHPSDIVKPNQEVEVVILSVDQERERISLGYKQLQPKPWDNAVEKYPVGSIVDGKVVRIVPFGAFVELEPGLDGLVHISQVAPQRIAKVEEVLSVGDLILVKVLEVNPETKRISLSVREAYDYSNIDEQIAEETEATEATEE